MNSPWYTPGAVRTDMEAMSLVLSGRSPTYRTASCTSFAKTGWSGSALATMRTEFCTAGRALCVCDGLP